MSTSGHSWNAAEILKIEDLCTCVGWAPSKGRKCGNRIAAANQRKASNILCRMGSLDVTTADVRIHLEELAPRMLCKRYHQDQASEMVSQWMCEVERQQEHVEGMQLRRRQQQAQVTVSIQISTGSAHTLSSPTDATLIVTRHSGIQQTRTSTPFHSIPTQLPSPPTTPNRHRAHNSAPATMPTPSQQLPTPPTNRRRDHDAVPATTPTPTQQLPTPPTTPNRRRDHHSIPATTPPPTPSLPSVPVTTTPLSSRPTTSPSAPTTTEATASPPTSSPQPDPAVDPTPPPSPPFPTISIEPEECSICYDPVAPSTAISSQCGHLFHATCINTWIDTQDHSSSFASRGGAAHQCPYCRSEWTRRKVEGDCCICLDPLTHQRPEPEPASESEAQSESASKLVWCQSCCGQNFHRECMEKWLAEEESTTSTIVTATEGQEYQQQEEEQDEQEERRRVGKCPDCRAEWVA